MSFFEIFQPGLQHLREERDRLKMLVVRPTHGGGGRLGIDLEAGTAKINVPRPEVPAEPDATAEVLADLPPAVPAEVSAKGPEVPTEMPEVPTEVTPEE